MYFSDSGFNVMAVYEASRHGPEIVYRFTGIRKWVVRLWKRPFWFSTKIYVTFSSKWTFPYPGGCSQVLISSKKFDSSICDWKINFPFSFGKYDLFRNESFWVDFRCVHRLQLLKVCDQYVTIPNSLAYNAYPRNNPGKTFLPNWWNLDWSFAEIGWYSTIAPNAITGPLHGSPNRLSKGVFQCARRSWTFRR